MPQNTLSQVEALVKKFVAGRYPDSAVVDPFDSQRFHPDAVAFYNDDPNPDFGGFTKEPVFETNLLFGEMDDDRKYRIERKDGLTIYTRYETSSGMGVSNVSGQALACEQDSAAEKAFLRMALSDVTDAAAEPLQVVLRDAREAGLTLSPAATKALRASLFPPASK